MRTGEEELSGKLVRIRSGPHDGEWGVHQGLSEGGQHFVGLFGPGRETDRTNVPVSGFEEITPSDLDDTELQAYLEVGWGEVYESGFAGYADWWSGITGKTLEDVVGHLESELEMMAEEEESRCETQKEIHECLAERPVAADFIARFQTLEEPFQRMKRLLTEALDRLREVREMTEESV
jgi:hypothetical protein